MTGYASAIGKEGIDLIVLRRISGTGRHSSRKRSGACSSFSFDPQFYLSTGRDAEVTQSSHPIPFHPISLIANSCLTRDTTASQCSVSGLRTDNQGSGRQERQPLNPTKGDKPVACLDIESAALHDNQIKCRLAPEANSISQVDRSRQWGFCSSRWTSPVPGRTACPSGRRAGPEPSRKIEVSLD